MQKPTTENLGALVRNCKLNTYQLKLASNEMAFLEKYIEYLERQVKDNVVLPAVIKCENFKCDNKAEYFYCNDCENERNDI